MEQTTLKYLRTLVPGILLLLGFYPIYQYFFSNFYDIKSLDFTYLTFLSIIVGSIYYQLNIRRILMEKTNKTVFENIFNRLMNTYNKQLDENQNDFIKKKIMNVFYKLTDNDESLKKKANNVYFNGIFLTSTADASILSGIFVLIYLSFYFFLPSFSNSLTFSLMFLGILITSIWLNYLSQKEHIKLSNYQLDFIDDLKKKEVTEIIDEILTYLNNDPKKEDEQQNDILYQLPKPNAEEKPKNSKPDKKGIPRK